LPARVVACSAGSISGPAVPHLPGRATVSGSGRADAQVAVDAEGELYILSKTDGMIRAVQAPRR